MSRQRRSFSAKFKSDLVIELLKGEKDLNTLAAENNIQPNLLRNWKKEFLNNASVVFDDKREDNLKEKLAEERKEKAVAELSGHRILLAEDNELNWEVARELLSDLGLELEWAEDGRVCLEKFEQSQAGYYDLILMDIRMPHMTGYEAAQAIRKSNHPDASFVPIIAMSADAFPEDIRRCLECGMNDHIAKPIDITEMAKLLERYLK